MGGGSIFDNITAEDIVMAFFPCTLFEAQQLLWFRGDNWGARNWSIEKKLEYNIKKHNELHNLYTLICKLAIVVVRKQLKLIIENPYTEQHYLTRYWCIKSSKIDNNRTLNGDYYVKPTQYWFINCEPKDNEITEPLEVVEKKDIVNTHNRVERSMIHPQYARRFIKRYIIDTDGKNEEPNKEKTILDFL